MNSPIFRRGLQKAVPLALAVAGVTGAALTTAPAASATAITYCDGAYTNDCEAYERHSLVRNHVRTLNATRYVAASAIDTNGNQYGNWVYGTSTGAGANNGACHSYSGGNLLRAWAFNSQAVAAMYPRYAYGSGEGPCNLSRLSSPEKTAVQSELDAPNSTRFESPSGTGVLNDDGAGNVCLSIPDPVDGFGTSCAPRALVANDGLSVAIVAKDGTALSAASLPPVGGRAEATRKDASAWQAKTGQAGIVTFSGPLKSIQIYRGDNTKGSTIETPAPPSRPSSF